MPGAGSGIRGDAYPDRPGGSVDGSRGGAALTWQLPDDTSARFVDAFGVPGFLLPWLDRFFEESDVRLVLTLADGLGGPLLPQELCERLPGLVKADIDRAHHRGLLDRAPDGTLSLADFHARFEIWAIFEGWKDIPPDVRTALNEWELEHYERKKRPQIEALRQGREPDPDLENSEYLLLAEAEALLERAERVYLWPCNCRSMMGECAKPVAVCLRFSNDRGVGWEISRERARDVLREANKAGLMQTGEVVESAGRVTGAICNCCSDCCYPHIVSARLGAEKLWPRSRYLARRVVERCTECGRCARRCPFGAFVAERRERGSEAGGTRYEIGLRADLCRGCGVCATGCPAEAIVMDPLPGMEPAATAPLSSAEQGSLGEGPPRFNPSGGVT